MNLTPSSALPTRGLAADATSLDGLNRLAGRDARAAIKETARQFEALFMKEMLKSMREATMKSGLTESEDGDLGTQLLDEQWAVQMTGQPGGLGEMIERQLSLQVAPTAVSGAAGVSGAQGLQGAQAGSLGGGVPRAGVAARSAAAVPALGASAATPASPAPALQATPAQAGFVAQHRDAAQQVSRETGIPASFMIGQAAHETGWGRSEIRPTDGGNSFNLFGIKAGPSWKGKVAEVTTTEYVDGAPRKVTAKFRAYDSYAESFRDYARLISQSPRFSQVMEKLHSPQAFAQGLQQAGYATDPRYADKLSRVINTALNLQRALG